MLIPCAVPVLPRFKRYVSHRKNCLWVASKGVREHPNQWNHFCDDSRNLKDQIVASQPFGQGCLFSIAA